MRATTKRPVGVNQAAPRFAFEQWTRAIVNFGKFLAAGRAKTFRRDERFALGKLWREAGEVKLAAFRARDTGAGNRPFCQFRIHRPDFTKSVL